jgi:hypothetical protein
MASVSYAQQLEQTLFVYQAESFLEPKQLTATGHVPIAGVPYSPCPHHVHVDIEDAA